MLRSSVVGSFVLGSSFCPSLRWDKFAATVRTKSLHSVGICMSPWTAIDCYENCGGDCSGRVFHILVRVFGRIWGLGKKAPCRDFVIILIEWYNCGELVCWFSKWFHA